MIYVNIHALIDAVLDEVNQKHHYTGYSRYGSGSVYMRFDDEAGEEFTIRISNHSKSGFAARDKDQVQTFNTNDIKRAEGIDAAGGIRVEREEWNKFIDRICNCVARKKNAPISIGESNR